MLEFLYVRHAEKKMPAWEKRLLHLYRSLCVCTIIAQATAKATASDQLLCLETSQTAIPNVLTKGQPVFVRGRNLFQMPWRNLRQKTVTFALLLSTDLLQLLGKSQESADLLSCGALMTILAKGTWSHQPRQHLLFGR